MHLLALGLLGTPSLLVVRVLTAGVASINPELGVTLLGAPRPLCLGRLTRCSPWHRSGLGMELALPLQSCTSCLLLYLAYFSLFCVASWVYRRCVSRHGSILDLHAHRLRLFWIEWIGPKRLLSWWRYCLMGPDLVARLLLAGHSMLAS